MTISRRHAVVIQRRGNFHTCVAGLPPDSGFTVFHQAAYLRADGGSAEPRAASISAYFESFGDNRTGGRTLSTALRSSASSTTAGRAAIATQSPLGQAHTTLDLNPRSAGDADHISFSRTPTGIPAPATSAAQASRPIPLPRELLSSEKAWQCNRDQRQGKDGSSVSRATSSGSHQGGHTPCLSRCRAQGKSEIAQPRSPAQRGLRATS